MNSGWALAWRTSSDTVNGDLWSDELRFAQLCISRKGCDHATIKKRNGVGKETAYVTHGMYYSTGWDFWLLVESCFVRDLYKNCKSWLRSTASHNSSRLLVLLAGVPCWCFLLTSGSCCASAVLSVLPVKYESVDCDQVHWRRIVKRKFVKAGC